MEHKPYRRQIVVLGDGEVGKTCLLLRYVEGTGGFERYVPTMVANYNHEIKFRHTSLLLDLRDTAGQARFQAFRNEELGRLKPHACLICFSINDQRSYENARTGWIKLANDKFPLCPVLLVGTKSDLRGCDNNWEVDVKDADRVAHKWNSRYFECSALTGDKLKWLFEQVIALTLDPPCTSGCSCTVG